MNNIHRIFTGAVAVTILTGAVATAPAAFGADNSSSMSTGMTTVQKFTPLLSGMFESVGDHEVSGEAVVVSHGDGTRALHLKGFSSDRGPDLKVVLASVKGDATELTPEQYVDLGPLKSLTGDQIYTISPEVILDEVASVVIWCDEFDVAFGTAELKTGAEAPLSTSVEGSSGTTGTGSLGDMLGKLFKSGNLTSVLGVSAVIALIAGIIHYFQAMMPR
ncbi:DM13 domain-containing protein [Corynebacterium meridianum]|uniref:DM13 domain-containing protein n=1 Tax=Corynebacterium meridianum TaxID=2765363 RepID=A0A934M725_9CORY|nr:DM13 domain-containing protein [Corynebacterium meridianum]